MNKKITSHIKVPIHTAFYQWASRWVEQKRVLDVGCGEGYGTAILSQRAGLTIGIDESFKFAYDSFKNHSMPNTRFLNMDCQSLAFRHASFDVLINNALLEYLTDYTSFFKMSKEILKPGGIFICGTKNAQLSIKTSTDSLAYRNHLQEFTPASLLLLLKDFFSDVEIYGLMMKPKAEAYIMNKKALTLERILVKSNIKGTIPKNWRKWVRKLFTGMTPDDIKISDFEVVKDVMDNSFYIIGVGYNT